MPKLNESSSEVQEFEDCYLRELDMALQLMQPFKRAGFLQSAYLRALRGQFGSLFLIEMAALLTKHSSEKRTFLTHAQKLLKLAEQTPDQVAPVADRLSDSGVRDLRGDRHALVNSVLSDTPGPILPVEEVVDIEVVDDGGRTGA